jgi:WW domain-containing oxidoreductase
MAFGFDSTAEQVTEGLDLDGKTFLVTGMNSGLGFEAVRVLALRGAAIIGLARTAEKAAGALAELGINGVPVACELSDLGSVQAAVAQVQGLGVKLDGLIANAGIMALPELRQQDGIELQFFTNHVGHFGLVTGLLDQLAEDGRVVVLSSGAHFLAKRGLELDNLSGEDEYSPWRMYGRSKLANILFTRSLSARFEGTSRTANAVHPGVILTNLSRHIADAETMFSRLTLKTVEQGAATEVYVATHPSLAGTSGEYFADCAIADTLDAARDDELAAQLWAVSEQLVAWARADDAVASPHSTPWRWCEVRAVQRGRGGEDLRGSSGVRDRAPHAGVCGGSAPGDSATGREGGR